MIHPAKIALHLSNNQGQVSQNDLSKLRLQLFAHGDDFLSSLDNVLIKRDQKSTNDTYVELQAFAGACVQRTSRSANFWISAEYIYMKVVKYYDLLLLSRLESASIMRRTVSTNLGPVSREFNPFRVYSGCHKSRSIFKMTTFHFKSSKLILR